MADNSIEVNSSLALAKTAALSSRNLDPIYRDNPSESTVAQTDQRPISASEVQEAANSLENIVSVISDTALSFSFEEQLHRMVVAVRAVGSDEIIRQFPPEEFISVAKFIQAQDIKGGVSEDFLKGILFDERT